VKHRFALAVAVAVPCAAACAVGAQDEGQPDAHVYEPPPDAGKDAYVAPPYDAGGTPDTGAFDAGVDAPPAGDAGDDSGISCDSPNLCSTATNIGTISGDTSGPNATATGDTAQWLQLNVTENDSSPLAVPMKLKLVLDSPPGTNFDLYVYMGTAPGQVQCTSLTRSSTNPAGQPDEIDLEWGETGTFANGVDDSEVASIEVQYVSGTCQTGETWSLTATGHGQ
jgi:hypothetical protein